MTYSVNTSGKVLQIVLSGEIDLSSTNDIRNDFEQIISSDFSEVVIDGGSLEYIDSSGVATILMIRRRCTQMGLSMRIQQMSEIGFRVIQLAKLDGLLKVEHVLREATDIDKLDFQFSHDTPETNAPQVASTGMSTTPANNPSSPTPKSPDINDLDIKPGSFN